MIIRKTVRTLLLINGLQLLAVLCLAVVVSDQITGNINPTVFLAAVILTAILLLSSLITLLGLYASSRSQDASYRESMKNLEDLNLKLRAQRHDYMNHIQVIYGLLELGEYEEARRYMEPVFRDITKVTKALKTYQPAVNALLRAKMESAEQKGISMTVEVGTPLKKIPLPAWELCKVLSNLIDNAITALEEGQKEGRAERPALTVEICQEPGCYIFNVGNNGPRIPEECREMIFHQGFTTKKEEGHGTGLTIVSEIVKEAGGSIALTSEEEKTCFEVRLPA